MLYYLYDGTFHGLLTAAGRALKRGEMVEDIIPAGEEGRDLFGSYVHITADNGASETYSRIIERKMGEPALKNVICCYLSDEQGSGRVILDYLAAGMAYGKGTGDHLTDARVFTAHKLAARVKKEGHRMKGLVRFREVEGGWYYAPLEPDHNIVPLIAPHFARRFTDQKWIIHDITRGLAAKYEEQSYDIMDIGLDRVPRTTSREKLVNALWKSYYKQIAIAGRSNPRLRSQLMPKRYWKYLIEME